MSPRRGNAIEAAVEAVDQLRRQRHEQRQTLALEVDQATYEARLAARRYEAVDPENRLVAAELETRWNEALQHVRILAEQLDAFDRETPHVPIPDRALLVSLAQDLPTIWHAPTTDMRLKQRFVRILLHKIVADVDADRREIVLLLHWVGGRHSELRVKKHAPGQHGRCTSLEAIEVVRQLAGTIADDQIAATLNRLRLRTGAGNAWNTSRIQSLRAYHALPAFDANQPRTHQLTLQQAARRLGVSPTSVRRLIRHQLLPASQVVSCAPWEIPADALESEVVRQAVEALKQRTSRPRTPPEQASDSMFSEGGWRGVAVCRRLGHARADQVASGRAATVEQEPVRDLGLPTRIAERGAPPGPGRRPAGHPSVPSTAGALPTIQHLVQRPDSGCRVRVQTTGSGVGPTTGVVSVSEKAGLTSQVCAGKTNESEPLTTCRKRRDVTETGLQLLVRVRMRAMPADGSRGDRHEGGVSPAQARAPSAST